MRAVRRDDEEARIAQAQQLVVVARSVDVDVREETAVLVARFDITLERHGAAREPAMRVVARLGTEALHRVAGILRLRCVSAEDSHSFERSAMNAHDDRVAVDHFHDGCGKSRRTATTYQPSPPDAPEQGGHDEAPG